MKGVVTGVLLIAGCAATFAGGWYGATLPETSSELRSVGGRPAQIKLIPEKPNLPFSASAATLRKLGLGKPDAPPPTQDVSSEPDPGEALRRAISAVVKEGQSYVLIVAETSPSAGWGRRKPGDPFQNGWKFVSISPSAVTIRRGGQDVTVPVMSAMAPPDAGQPAPAVTPN